MREGLHVIEVDVERCAGAGMCTLLAPELFDQTDVDGTVIVLRAEVMGPAVDLALQCARTCPTGAVSVRSR